MKNPVQKSGVGSWFKPLLLVAALGLGGAMAQDSLYDPAPPANSAFVRLFNDNTAPTDATLDTKTFKGGSHNATPYLVIPEGSRAFAAGKVSASFAIKAGKFYTIVLGQGQAVLMEDLNNTNRTKSLVALYNLTDGSALSLKTADGKTNVLEGVVNNTNKAIIVNGVKIAFGVFGDGKSLSTLPETQLERGAAYSVFVTGTKDAPKVVWVQSSTSVK